MNALSYSPVLGLPRLHGIRPLSALIPNVETELSIPEAMVVHPVRV
jgi:hypothetical protein